MGAVQSVPEGLAELDGPVQLGTGDAAPRPPTPRGTPRGTRSGQGKSLRSAKKPQVRAPARWRLRLPGRRQLGTYAYYACEIGC